MTRSALLLALAACTTSEWVGSEPAQSRVETKRIPLAQPLDLDVLFVIDNAQAMAPYVETIRANAPRFIQALDDRGRPQLHLAVTTSDAADDGALRLPAGNDFVDDFVVDFDRGGGRRLTNYDGDLGALLTAALDAGAAGTAANRPFDAARRALLRHQRFARRDSVLYVVFVTARDDASTTSPEALVALMRDFKSAPELVVAGFITPRLDGRFAALDAALANRSRFTTIDQADLSDAFPRDPSLEPKLFDLCFDGVDLDAATPGPQASCAGWLAYDDGRPDRPLRDCAIDGAGPCWTLVTDESQCTSPTSYRFELTYADAVTDRASELYAECLTQ